MSTCLVPSDAVISPQPVTMPMTPPASRAAEYINICFYINIPDFDDAWGQFQHFLLFNPHSNPVGTPLNVGRTQSDGVRFAKEETCQVAKYSTDIMVLEYDYPTNDVSNRKLMSTNFKN